MDPGFLRHHHGRAAGEPPARPQGDRDRQDHRLIADNPAQLVVEALAGLPEQRHHRDRPRDHARAGHRRGKIQEVVVQRQEGRRQGSPHRRPGEKDRMLRPARNAGLRRRRDHRAVQQHPLRPPPHRARRGAARRRRMQEETKTDLSAVLKGVAEAVQGQQPARRRRAPLRRRRARRSRQARRRRRRHCSSPPKPRWSPTSATCPPSPKRSRFSFSAVSSSWSRTRIRSNAATSSSTCSRSRRASSRPSASISWSRTATPTNSPPPSSAGRPSRISARRCSCGSSRTATRRNSPSCSTT